MQGMLASEPEHMQGMVSELHRADDPVADVRPVHTIQIKTMYSVPNEELKLRKSWREIIISWEQNSKSCTEASQEVAANSGEWQNILNAQGKHNDTHHLLSITWPQDSPQFQHSITVHSFLRFIFMNQVFGSCWDKKKVPCRKSCGTGIESGSVQSKYLRSCAMLNRHIYTMSKELWIQEKHKCYFCLSWSQWGLN